MRVRKVEHFHMTLDQERQARLICERLHRVTAGGVPGWRREMVQDGLRLYKLIKACIHDEPEPVQPFKEGSGHTIQF